MLFFVSASQLIVVPNMSHLQAMNSTLCAPLEVTQPMHLSLEAFATYIENAFVTKPLVRSSPSPALGHIQCGSKQPVEPFG
jgi:hypothetical protein